MSGRVVDRVRGRDARRAPVARHGRRGRPRRACSATTSSSASSAVPTSSARSKASSRPPRRAARAWRTRSRGIDRLCARSFEAVASLGERAEGVYLVGGTVRDILLGEESFDVDIAVEGDAIAFARALASALGGRFTPHEKFGTAIVQYGDGERVDVVTTRTEFYDAPGALPTVERAGLREDLFRRDFTINAMAASLKPRRLRAPRRPVRRPRRSRGARAAGAPQPLVHRRPDADLPRHPVRGALRLPASTSTRRDSPAGASRWGSSATCRPHASATSSSRCSRIPARPDGIVRLGELGVDRAIHPHLRGDAEAAALFERARALRDELDVDVPVWRLGIAVLARDLTLGRGVRLARAAQGPSARRRADRRRDRASRRGSSSGFGAEQLDACAGRRARRRVRARRSAARAGARGPRRAPRLLRAPSRASSSRSAARTSSRSGFRSRREIGEVLAEIRRRKLNGELDGRESELAAARELDRRRVDRSRMSSRRSTRSPSATRASATRSVPA